MEPRLSGIEDALIEFTRDVYDLIQWPGVIILMALETVIFFIPSEAVLTLAGWMLVKDKGHGVEYLPLAAALAAVGSTLGSIFVYYVGVWGGRPLIARYGRYFFITTDDIRDAERFFDRWGKAAVCFGRMVPLVRTFVSIPAGVTRMDLRSFTIYTFVGSFVWSLWLVALGYVLGENWEDIRAWTRPVEIPIAVLLMGLVAWYVYSHVKKAWRSPQPSGPEA